MSGSGGDPGDDDSLSLVRLIDQICDQFESEFKCGRAPRIEEFLQQIPAVGRVPLLRELVAIEVDLTRARATEAGWAAYYKRFPADHAVLDSLDAEWKLSTPLAEPGNTPHGDESVTDTVTVENSVSDEIRHFHLLSIAGEGGFGIVWRAWDRQLEREVAIKVLRPGLSSQFDADVFLREARVVAKLRHPNIVPIHEIGEQKGATPWYIVSELIDGPNLEKWLLTFDKSPRATARLVLKIATALAHAHERGIVHRDLKPANILIDKNGEPLLTDFGLAKHDARADLFAVDGCLVGTIRYMAPEQARGSQADVEQRTDIYALGVITYELLTGQPPFQGNRDRLLEQIPRDQPPQPRKLNPRIPVDLEQLCLKCLAKEPSDRYQTANELVRDLEHFLADEPLEGVTVPRTTALRKWGKRHRRLVATISATFFGCCCLAIMLWLWNAPPSTKRLVEFETDPPGCEITVVRLDDTTGDPDPTKIQHAWGRTPLKLRLEPGDYLVVPVLNESRFHEVIRHVPARSEGRALAGYSYAKVGEDGCIRYPLRIKIPQTTNFAGMSLLNGNAAWACPPDASILLRESGKYQVPAFYVDRQETQARRTAGPQNPAPRSRRFSEAVIYAEFIGKRLPTNLELLYLADTVKQSSKQVQKPGIELLPNGQEIRGLSARPWDWTSTKGLDTQPGKDSPNDILANRKRVVRCGDQPLSRQRRGGIGTTYFYPFELVAEHDDGADTCVRCVRSPKPRRRPEDFIQYLEISGAPMLPEVQHAL